VAQASSFRRVEAIGRTLPGVEVTTSWGQPALKVRGKMFACIASHQSAEPGTLVVRMDIIARDALIADDPETYYLKEHYVGYPCVLVRLSRVRADALKDLVTGAYRYVAAKQPVRKARPRRRT
jgi:hypothetical protein